MNNITKRILSGIYHWPLDGMLKQTFVKKGLKRIIIVRIPETDQINEVFLRTAEDGEERLYSMKPVTKAKKELSAPPDGFIHFEARISYSDPDLHYRFIINTNDMVYHYNARGITDIIPEDRYDFRFYQDISPAPWIYKSVFYAIFPDRFHASGNHGVKTSEYEYLGHQPTVRDWEDEPLTWKKGKCLDFFNGDLDGISEKLSYLNELGINSIWLNPIFEAPTNHRYDTANYLEVDSHLGGNTAFARLLKAMRRRKMNIVLDGVFNHIGIKHPWFSSTCDIKGKGAQISEESPFSDYFIFDNHPDNYHCWLGIDTLPRLNFQSEKLRREIYGESSSPVQHWLRSPWKIDGWRFDVANMIARDGEIQLHKTVWPELISAARSANSESYLFGEHFFDGNSMVGPNLLDGIMNYLGFNFPIREWLTGTDRRNHPVSPTAQRFSKALDQIRSLIPPQWQLSMFNQLSSHDIPRLSSVLDEDHRTSLHIIAAAIMFGYPGVPCIYYGDEIGMCGGPDPYNRQPMRWNQKDWDIELFNIYRKLIHARRSIKALQFGGYTEIAADRDIFFFSRIFGAERVLIGSNKGQKRKTLKLDLIGASIYKNTIFIDLLSEKEYKTDGSILKISMKPESACFLYCDLSNTVKLV